MLMNIGLFLFQVQSYWNQYGYLQGGRCYFVSNPTPEMYAFKDVKVAVF